MAYLDVVRADRPHVLWPLDEGAGTVARDLSGNNRPGTITGSPVLRGGSALPGHAAPRFGTGKWVQSASSVTLGSSHAVECWYEKVTHLAGFPGDINNVVGELFTSSNGMLIRYDGAALLRLWYASSAGFQTLTAPAPPSLRRPVHIVGSAKLGGRARLIVNGRIVADAATVGTPAYTGNFRVGFDRQLDGPVGWAAAYAAELTPDAAFRHYAEGMRELRRRGRLAA